LGDDGLESEKSERPRSVVNSLYIEVEELEELNNRLQDRYREIAKNETQVELYNLEGAEYVICAYGTVARICKTAIAQLAKKGVKVGLVRPITIWPFPAEAVHDAVTAPGVKKALCVEMSAGQMIEDVKLAVNGEKEVELLGHPGSRVPTAEEIADRILQMRGA
jgi:2-oxoglutarate ferredoxin oxidoreductase subunit alpha